MTRVTRGGHGDAVQQDHRTLTPVRASGTVEGVPDSLRSVCDLSAVRMRRLIERGEVSATELVTAHLDRIAERNPALNAIVTLVPERALAEAADADKAASARRQEEALPPLHGLPVVIKDTHQTAGIR